jgi:general secretion pathway protein D
MRNPDASRFPCLLPRRLNGAATAAVLLALALLPAGCRSTPPAVRDAAPPAPEVGAVPAANPLAKPPPPDETALAAHEVAPPGTAARATWPARQAAPEEPPPTEYPSVLLAGIKDPDASVKVLFNFDAAPMSDVVPLFGALLNFHHLIDPGVKGALSMTLDTELTARQVWALFEHILWLSGAYASPNPGVIHVLPFNRMPQEQRLLVRHEPVPNVDVFILPVRHQKSAELLNLLKPFSTDGAVLTDLPRANALLVVETPANVAKLRELARRLDDRGEAAWPMRCLPCHAVDAEVLRDELYTLLPVLGYPVTDKSASGGEIKLTALARLQVLVVSAALPEVLDEVERWARELDRESENDGERMFFYNVRRSTAEHLNEALGTFFNASGRSSERAAASRSVSSRAAAPAGTTESPAAPRAPAATGARSTGERRTVFDNPVVVYADREQNRLTIRTTPRTYAMVEAVLRRLDVAPRQVLIEATVAEILLNKTTEFGFAYAAKTRWGDQDFRVALLNAGVSFLDDGGGVIDPATTGLAMLMNKGTDRMAFIKAVAGETNVRVISTPQIMATNDQEALINVGDRVPIVTGEQRDTTTSSTSGSVYQNIQYTDTGIILTVTPTITVENEVRLAITQEVSSAVETETSKINSPTIQTRKLQTQLTVPDGGTVLLGGLIRSRASDSHGGLPWIKDIPLLGRLFRDNNLVDNRSELLVMVTVNVVGPAAELDTVVARYRAALRELRAQRTP